MPVRFFRETAIHPRDGRQILASPGAGRIAELVEFEGLKEAEIGSGSKED
jgi:hypothetical protein